MRLCTHRVSRPPACLLAVTLSTGIAFGQLPGAIYTTDKSGTPVNQNVYGLAVDVYLSGGPQNGNTKGLPDGTYYFQITDPNGSVLLSTDNAACRQLVVSGGRVAGASPASGTCKHNTGTFNPADGTTPVQMAPFTQTPNAGGEYKAWLIAQTSSTSISTTNPKVINFDRSDANTDNFKVQTAPVPPAGSCQPSSSLTAFVSGTNAVAYVPKGNWSGFGVAPPGTGVSVVNVEGSSVTPTKIATPNVVNSCAVNSLSGQVVCTGNNTDIYLISGTTLNSTLTSGGSGVIGFSGGNCTNCGVAMDALHNRAVIGLSIAGAPGFQVLDLGSTPTLESAFPSPSRRISEDPLIDPIRNLLLSAAENSNYEIVNLTTSTSPSFFENNTGAGELDSAGEDCTTGIALAPAEFALPSKVVIADMTQATFTAGAPAGTWTAPSQIQTLSESNLPCAGSSGVAVAQGTHVGLVTDEFGCSGFTAIALPVASGSGIPAISDWVTCSIPGGFRQGADPHTVTAYQSPNSGDAVGVVANLGASQLAVVDLTMMLNPAIVPRDAGGHACASGTLPSAVVSFVSVP